MKIITGIAKGQTLKTIKNTTTRPTTSRIRENIFNLIQNEINNRICLDLFAGFGGIGIELLSRGAKFVTFVDCIYKNIKIIQTNLHKCGFEKQAEVLPFDYRAAVRWLHRQNRRYDLIFLDPPFSKNFWTFALQKIQKFHLLNSDAIIVLECPKSTNLSATSFPNMHLITQRFYGSIQILIWKFNSSIIQNNVESTLEEK